jgi:hypothetical protein
MLAPPGEWQVVLGGWKQTVKHESG